MSLPDDLRGRHPLEHHLAVNLYGTWDVTQAFLPALTRSHGTIVNVVSLAAFAAVPVLPAYFADGTVYQTYSTTGRGVEFLMTYYGVLDRAANGRDEGDGFQLWIQRRDEYDNEQ